MVKERGYEKCLERARWFGGGLRSLEVPLVRPVELADSRVWLLVGGLVYLLGRPKLFGASLTRTLRLVDWKLCRDD